MKKITSHYLRILSNFAQCGSWATKNFVGKVAGENANKLWYYLRSVDRQGSGKAYLSISIAANFFKKSQTQVRRYLADGLRLGFFRSIVTIRPGIVLIYYRGTIPLAQKLGLTELGAIALVPLSALNELREYATKIVILANQRASEFRQKSKKLAGTILDPTAALRPCGIASRGILFSTRRYLIVKASTQLVGGSQKTTAKKLGRSQTTVNSHLSTLSSVEKRQVAIADRFNWLEVGKNTLEHKPNLGLFKLKDFPVPLKSYCSIYSLPEIELIPQKYLRRKLKIALKQSVSKRGKYYKKTTKL